MEERKKKKKKKILDEKRKKISCEMGEISVRQIRDFVATEVREDKFFWVITFCP
jgi:hypothetical protein